MDISDIVLYHTVRLLILLGLNLMYCTSNQLKYPYTSCSHFVAHLARYARLNCIVRLSKLEKDLIFIQYLQNSDTTQPACAVHPRRRWRWWWHTSQSPSLQWNGDTHRDGRRRAGMERNCQVRPIRNCEELIFILCRKKPRVECHCTFF